MRVGGIVQGMVRFEPTSLLPATAAVDGAMHRVARRPRGYSTSTYQQIPVATQSWHGRRRRPNLGSPRFGSGDFARMELGTVAPSGFRPRAPRMRVQRFQGLQSRPLEMLSSCGESSRTRSSGFGRTDTPLLPRPFRSLLGAAKFTVGDREGSRRPEVRRYARRGPLAESHAPVADAPACAEGRRGGSVRERAGEVLGAARLDVPEPAETGDCRL